MAKRTWLLAFITFVCVCAGLRWLADDRPLAVGQIHGSVANAEGDGSVEILPMLSDGNWYRLNRYTSWSPEVGNVFTLEVVWPSAAAVSTCAFKGDGLAGFAPDSIVVRGFSDASSTQGSDGEVLGVENVEVKDRSIAIRMQAPQTFSRWQIEGVFLSTESAAPRISEMRLRGSLGGKRWWVQLLFQLGWATVAAALVFRLASRRGDRRGRWVRTIALGAAGVLGLFPVLRTEIWPRSHDAYHYHERAEIYAAQIMAGNLLPVWSAASAEGYGSPLPILYHKLYTAVSASFLIATQTGFWSHFLTLWGGFAIGVSGLYAALRHLGVSRWWATLFAALLPFGQYSFAVWLIRGAMAEFMAMQLLPWGVLWCLRALDGYSPRKLALQGAFFFPVLYLAHSAIFLYFGFPVAVALLLRFIRFRDRRQLLGAIAVIVGVLSFVIVPIFLLQHRLAPPFQFFSQIGMYRAEDYLAYWAQVYALAPHFWGKFDGWYRADMGMVIGLLVLGSTLFVALVWARCRKGATFFSDARWWSGGVVIVFVCFYAALYTPPAVTFYRHVPLMNFLQFPFRLHSFLTVFGLLGLAWFGQLLMQRSAPWRILAAVVLGSASLWTVVISPVWYPRVGRINGHDTLQTRLGGGQSYFVGAAFEYFPPIEGAKNGYPAYQALRRLTPQPDILNWEIGAARISAKPTLSPEASTRIYEVSRTAETVGPETIVLPFTRTGYERVSIFDDERWQAVATEALPRDPRVRFALPPEAKRIRYEAPTLLRVLFAKSPDGR